MLGVAFASSSCVSLWITGHLAVQEDKMRRQAGLEGLRSWTAGDEAKMASSASRVCRALCFSYVKV